MVTTDPTSFCSRCTTIMSVDIPKRDYDRWLDVSDPERPPLDLLRPYPAQEITACRVDKTKKLTNDQPEWLE